MIDMGYSALDRPEILRFVFHPRQDLSAAPRNAQDHLVGVADDIDLSCRFYAAGPRAPSILFFHGNGEVAADYDGIAPFYTDIGINLMVADYRGYGRSGGSPSFSAMIADAQTVYAYFRSFLKTGGYDERLFIMGRSLGAHPAIEMACRHSDEIRGLILESGFAAVGRLLGFLSAAGDAGRAEEIALARLARIRSITLPVLILHGDYDVLAPPEQAKEFYETVGSTHKRLVTIRGAGHNDIVGVGMEAYFSAIREFVLG